MAKVKIDWSLNAFEQIRHLPEVQQQIGEMTDGIAAAANQSTGGGYTAVVEDGGDRVRGAVYTESYEAIRDNARNNTLIKALNAGRRS